MTAAAVAPLVAEAPSAGAAHSSTDRTADRMGGRWGARTEEAGNSRHSPPDVGHRENDDCSHTFAPSSHYGLHGLEA